ncbi:MAG TPA: DinB family protein [Pyrinomonadaceae bacterium]
MHKDLENLRKELDAVITDVRSAFSDLTREQINWKPSVEVWSVGQCFEHLNVGGAAMLKAIEGKVDYASNTTFFERLPILPGLFGKLVSNAVSPDAVRKLKSLKIFAPAGSSVDADVIAKFLDLQPSIASAMARCENVDTIMTSPVARFVTYSLLDGFRIVVWHERRHLAQAKRVMENAAFPQTTKEGV